jgi:hypothetical protein
VVLGGAGSVWLPPDEWLRRVRDPRDADNIPVEAFLDVAYGPPDQGALRPRSFGMMATLALPDLEIDDARAAHDDERHRLCERVLWAACRLLAREDDASALTPGSTMTVGLDEGRASFRVVGFTDEDRQTLRLADVAASS